MSTGLSFCSDGLGKSHPNVVTNSKAVKDDSEGFDGVPSNHDGKDSAIIGTLCVNGRSVPWRWHGAAADEPAKSQSAERDQAIRYFVRQLDTAQRIKQIWCGKYFSSLRWMREPSVKTWLTNKKRRDGGKGGKAATGIMRRLAAAAWHAGQGEVFDPKRLFPGARALVAKD